jgi:hypothetical protein
MLVSETVSFSLHIVQHEARLTGSARSIQDKHWDWSEPIELGTGQPLLSMRLFGYSVVAR